MLMPKLILFLLHLAMTRSEEVVNICKQISSGLDPLMVVGELRNSILIVTKKMNVLNIGKESLLNDSFILKNAEATPIEKIFPKFATSKHYRKVKDFIYTGRIFSYHDYEYLDLDTHEKYTEFKGVHYLINEGKLSRGRRYHGSKYDWTLVSKIGQKWFWGFASVEKGKFMRDIYSYENGFDSFIGGHEKIRQICQRKNSSELYLTYRKRRCEAPLDWGSRRGFITNDTMYLFNEKDVVTFPESVLEGVAHQYKKIPYKSFFNCEANFSARNIPMKATKSSMIGLIILLISLLIILALCLMIGMVVVVNKRTRNTRMKSSRSSFSFLPEVLSRDQAAEPLARGLKNSDEFLSRASRSGEVLSRASKINKSKMRSNARATKTTRSGL